MFGHTDTIAPDPWTVAWFDGPSKGRTPRAKTPRPPRGFLDRRAVWIAELFADGDALAFVTGRHAWRVRPVHR